MKVKNALYTLELDGSPSALFRVKKVRSGVGLQGRSRHFFVCVCVMILPWFFSEALREKEKFKNYYELMNCALWSIRKIRISSLCKVLPDVCLGKEKPRKPSGYSGFLPVMCGVFRLWRSIKRNLSINSHGGSINSDWRLPERCLYLNCNII